MADAQNVHEVQSPRISDQSDHINTTERHSLWSYSTALKRVLDIFLALILAPAFLPVIGTAVLLVRLDGGSGFFGHTRVGRDGKHFTCWKIRTMVPDAQEKLAKYLKTNVPAKTEWENTRKLRNDPRITRIGRFLRETSLDEFPQIWNVLKGDMSFVGPRPVTEDEIKFYGKNQYVYTALRPGVTGLWQVSGRNDVSYLERVRLDREYLDSISFKTDVTIIAKTAGVVFRKTGI
ncbi:MAG: sugar transferase [Pseudomonadota bacterium]